MAFIRLIGQLFVFIYLPSPKDMPINFRERGREGERERNIERETSIRCL